MTGRSASPSPLGRRGQGHGRGAVYAIDCEEPRLLHAKLLRSPVAAGADRAARHRACAALPGVRAIVTAADVPASPGCSIKDLPLFADDVVRYVGEPVAAVAADTRRAGAGRRGRRSSSRSSRCRPSLTSSRRASPTEHRSSTRTGSHTRARSRQPSATGTSPVGGRRRTTATSTPPSRATTSSSSRTSSECRARTRRTSSRGCVVASYEAGRYVVHTSTQWPYQVRKTVGRLPRRASGRRPGDRRHGRRRLRREARRRARSRSPRCSSRVTGRPVKLVNTRSDEFVSGTMPRERDRPSALGGDRRGRDRRAGGRCASWTPAPTRARRRVDRGVACSRSAGNYRVGARRARGHGRLHEHAADRRLPRRRRPVPASSRRERHMDHIARRARPRPPRAAAAQRLSATATRPDRPGVRTTSRSTRRSRASRRSRRGRRLTRAAAEPRASDSPAVTWITNAGPGGVDAQAERRRDGRVDHRRRRLRLRRGGAGRDADRRRESLGLDRGTSCSCRPDTDAAPYDMGAARRATTVAVGNAALRRGGRGARAHRSYRRSADRGRAGGPRARRREGARRRSAGVAAMRSARSRARRRGRPGRSPGTGATTRIPCRSTPQCSVGNLLPSSRSRPFTSTSARSRSTRRRGRWADRAGGSAA